MQTITCGNLIVNHNTKHMITTLTHMNVFVLNQDSAYEFYTKKLGFKVIVDVPMGNGQRWLTVAPPGHPDFEINLTLVAEGHWYGKEAAESLRELIKAGTFGCGVFTCNDVYATYEELKAKGVVFKSEPKEQFYGIEAIITDGCGNWFSMTQPKEG